MYFIFNIFYMVFSFLRNMVDFKLNMVEEIDMAKL